MDQSNNFLCNPKPWSKNPNNIWLGSTVTLNRNLEKFKFPGKLSVEKRNQIIALISKELMGIKQLKDPKLFKSEEMSALDKEFLEEHFISQQSFQQAQAGEAFIVDKSGEFLGLLNLGDHLSLRLIDFHEEFETVWDRLVKMETILTNSLNFAYSPRFGFLTSEPTLCGTGLLVYVFLHLPALIYTDQLDAVVQKYKDEAVEVTGFQGDPVDMIGDIVAFHNRYTLGVTEENILSSLRTMTTKILVEEKSARTQLKNENDSEMKDRVSRAYAILLHSYQIEAIEALDAISLLKLGIDLEWVTGVDHTALNKLFFDTRRAYLLCHFGSKVAQEEIPHRRSEFIHEALKTVQLHI